VVKRGPAYPCGRILIVDDEAIIRGMLELELAQRYQVYTAESGTRALELLEDHPVDLVISDINMPGMKGYALLNEVRTRYPSMKTALITAYNTDDFIRIAKQNSIASIIPKSTPFNFDEFDAQVDALMTGQVFGLPRYLQPGYTIEDTYVIRDSREIDHVENMIVEQLPGPRRSEPFIRVLLEELITNAIYHAPVAADGSRKYPKHGMVQLEDGEEVTVTVGRDSEKWGVSVLDRGGRLTFERVLYHLDRHANAEGVFDESGRGLHMSRLFADRLVLNIQKNVATEAISLMYIEKTYIGFKPLYINVV
jgi:CheY-like chemotaxis protein